MNVRVKAQIADTVTKDSWIEEFDVQGDDPIAEVKEIIKHFNDTLRENEHSRELAGDIIVVRTNHSWVKTNLGTKTHGGKLFDCYECQDCHITGKRFGVNNVIIRDRKFKAKKYIACTTSSFVPKGIEEAKK